MVAWGGSNEQTRHQARRRLAPPYQRAGHTCSGDARNRGLVDALIGAERWTWGSHAPERAEWRDALPHQRHRDGEPLGEVLDPDPDGERDRAAERGTRGTADGAERDANRHALWKVMDRDRDYEEEQSAKLLIARLWVGATLRASSHAFVQVQLLE